jgi:cation transport ATPase
LTKGALIVARIHSFESQTEDDILQIAASVAHSSTHPLARAITTEAEKRNLPLLMATDFLNVAGLGMEASIADKRFFVGSRRLIRERGIAQPASESTNDAEVWIASG